MDSFLHRCLDDVDDFTIEGLQCLRDEDYNHNYIDWMLVPTLVKDDEKLIQLAVNLEKERDQGGSMSRRPQA